MIDGLFNSIIICIDRPFDMVSAPPFQMVYKGGRSSTNFEKGVPLSNLLREVKYLSKQL